jgi:hypothetical protein
MESIFAYIVLIKIFLLKRVIKNIIFHHVFKFV